MPNLRGFNFAAQGGGPTWRGNEPGGLTQIGVDQPFNSLPSLNWSIQGSGAAVVSDGSGPQSPGNVFVVTWPTGTAGGNGVGQAFRALSASYDTFYICCWQKFSSNWQGGTTPAGDGLNASKIMYPFVAGSNRFILEARAISNGPLLVSIGLQNTTVPSGSTFTTSASAFTRGAWDLVEVIVQGNTSGNADGFVKVFLNGTLVVQKLGIQWTAGAAQITDQLSLDPVWGSAAWSSLCCLSCFCWANYDRLKPLK